MTKERLEKLVNKMYYSYLDREEAQELIDYYENMEQENKQLKEDLRVSKSNEETYSLEMQEITKILGLDEHTLFDDVKDYAKQLKEQLENKIDLYEDTISYQLGFDKGKEYMQQRIDKAYNSLGILLQILEEQSGDKDIKWILERLKPIQEILGDKE